MWQSNPVSFTSRRLHEPGRRKREAVFLAPAAEPTSRRRKAGIVAEELKTERAVGCEADGDSEEISRRVTRIAAFEDRRIR
jgi:hypothetical protein